MSSYISSPSKTAEILNKYGIRLKKSLGQNFLIDANIAKKIVKTAEIKSGDAVLEIGSGIGTLTEMLLHSGSNSGSSSDIKIVCIEFDRLLVKVFKDTFKPESSEKLFLIEADALKLDYSEISRKYSINEVVSNLPYKIAAPLLIKILLKAPQVKNYYVTIQKDIADRMLARVGDKNYSSYTVKANFLADFKIYFTISRNCFIPKPYVDSVFLGITRKENIEIPEDFFNFIDACFQHRRKKLINSLADSGINKYVDKIDLTIRMLSDIGKGKNTRAEELNPEDYLFLYKNIFL